MYCWPSIVGYRLQKIVGLGGPLLVVANPTKKRSRPVRCFHCFSCLEKTMRRTCHLSCILNISAVIVGFIGLSVGRPPSSLAQVQLLTAVDTNMTDLPPQTQKVLDRIDR